MKMVFSNTRWWVVVVVFVFSVSVQVLSVSGRSPLDAATPAIELIKIRVKYRHASHAEKEGEDGNEYFLLHPTPSLYLCLPTF